MTVLVFMGVAGCGKTTAASLLTATLGWEYQEGDSLHPAANVEKMRLGTPLTDEDRWPWLDTIAAVIDDWSARGVSGALTCSALRRSYRDVIIGRRPGVRLVYIRGAQNLIASRMASRTGHFMPTSLLASQLATLEEPTPDERPITVCATRTPEEIVAGIIDALARDLPPAA